MPGNAFINFGADVPVGESTHATHKGSDGWIEISDWSWDIEADTSFTKGAGSAVGKPNPGTLSISHYYDLASPTIMTKIVQGTSFKCIHIVMLKQTGDSSGEGTVYFGIVATDVFITKVSSKGGEDGAVTQDVEMVFKGISIGYKQQKDKDGGGALEEKDKPFNWDISKMNLKHPMFTAWENGKKPPEVKGEAA